MASRIYPPGHPIAIEQGCTCEFYDYRYDNISGSGCDLHNMTDFLEYLLVNRDHFKKMETCYKEYQHNHTYLKISSGCAGLYCQF